MDNTELVGKIKQYLAAISSRKLQYAYFNIAPNTVILSNSSSNRQGTPHGDRLMAFRTGGIAVHIVTFKDPNFLDEVMTKFSIPKDVLYVVNVTKWNAVLGKASLEDLNSTITPDGTLIVRPKDEPFYPDDPDKKRVIGSVVDNFHIRTVLLELYEYSTTLGNEQHRNEHPHYLAKLDLSVYGGASAFLDKIDVSVFKDKQGNPLFNHHHNEITVVDYDGIGAPSFKSFIKKLKCDYKLTVYRFVEDGQSIYTATYYEDEFAYVKCLRPYTFVVPLPLSVKLDKTLNNFE